MIPLEILNNNRQIGISTSHIVQILSPVFQLFRIAARMKYGHNHDAFLFDEKVNYIREGTKNDCTPDFSSDFWKQLGIFHNSLKALLDRGSKFLSQSFAFAFIPTDGIVILPFREAAKDVASFHFPYLASSLALTSSHETTSLGLSRWSCKRRSISSASPGASSCEPTISSQRLRHSSTCSVNGSARASLKIVSGLHDFNLPRRFGSANQSGCPSTRSSARGRAEREPGRLRSPRTTGVSWSFPAFREASLNFGEDLFSRDSASGMLQGIFGAAIKFFDLLRRQFGVVSILLDIGPNLLRKFEAVGAAQLRVNFKL